DPYSRRTAFERGLNWMTQKFGNWTLMNQWNSVLKSWSGMIVQSRILDAARQISGGGEIAKTELRKMAQVGINEDMLR
ncbi:hypothetical protein QU700_33020, partial [Klebsiella pneumoniae]